MKVRVLASALNKSSYRLWLTPILLALVAPAAMYSQVLVAGDVVAGMGNGQYGIYSHGGFYKGTIGSPTYGYDTLGCAFTKDLTKLYLTDFDQTVVRVLDATGNTHPLLKTINTSSAGDNNGSLVFDHAGDWYVGHYSGAQGVLKYSPSDVPLMTYYPQIENYPPIQHFFGTAWLDLAQDGKTLFYTSLGNYVRRFDVASNTQLPDFSVRLPGADASAFRLLPPYDGSGGLLIADIEYILRLDKSGNVIQTYNTPERLEWEALDLDPNGTSFWAGDYGLGLLYRFNIASGGVEVGPIKITTQPLGSFSGGLCVRGGTPSSVDTTPPTITLNKITAAPPEQVVLASHDTESGLKSVAVLECSNCTAVNGPFTPGTNLTVLTTATKTVPHETSVIKLQATDMAGNTTTFDPVDFEISEEGGERRKTVDISPEETKIILSNGTPGIHTIKVRVNGTELPAIHLENGASDTIDISKDIVQGIQNQVTLSARGHIHGTAWVVITQP